MRSSNPVLTRSAGFNGTPAPTGSSQAGSGYTDPSAWDVAQPGYGSGQASGHGTPTSYGAPTARMTVETVVHKTAFTLATVVAAAAVTWVVIGDPVGTTAEAESAIATASGLAVAGAIIGFVLAMVNSFKKVVSPALVLAYAVFEGVFVGALSKVMVWFVGGDTSIVYQAVLGTMAAFAATLTVYRVFDIKVTDKFRRGFTAVLLGFVGLLLANFVLGFFGVGLGLRDMGAMGLVISVVSVVLGVICLVLDFDFVERGVAAGLPERDSWRAAFGLTVTLVWIYIEMLRILAILRGDG